MQTSFGDLTVVDAHAHFFFYRFFAALAASLPEPPSEEALFDTLGEHLAFEFPPKDPEELAKRWVKELDRHGLARSVLIASVPGDEESVSVAARAFPERFIPYFMLNPLAPDALDRTKRCSSHDHCGRRRAKVRQAPLHAAMIGQLAMRIAPCHSWA